MLYWYCSKLGLFILADERGNVLGTFETEEYPSGVAFLAYHRDERLDAHMRI